MNFFERKERYKSGQNPIPTQGEFEKQMVKVGDKWWPRGTVSKRDIYYGKPEEPQTPPIPITDIGITKYVLGVDIGHDVLESSVVRRGQIKPALNRMLPKLKDSEVHELYNLLMKFAIRIQEEEK